MTRVQLRQIDQSFGDTHVLRGLDLCVESGHYVVLLGPSGCGKSTTLRIIAGLQSPDRGDVLFDDRRVNAVAPRQRDVAMVFQHDSLYPHLTVGESIRFALRGRVSSGEMRARVDEAARLTATDSILNRYPSRLSGGELRRAAVAKAIARHSSIRLLDEPLSALDVPVRHALQDDILRWHAAVPGTTIHVTHDGQEAMRMADKIAVMEGGRIAQFAPPAEIYSQPCSVTVAQAIGSPPMNLFRARASDGIVEAPGPHFRCRLNLAASSAMKTSDVIVGARPDSFRIGGPEPDGSEDRRLVVSGNLIRAQSVGRDIHFRLDAGEQTVIAIVPIAEVDPQFMNSARIRLVARRRDLHLFDGESGLRIEADSDR